MFMIPKKINNFKLLSKFYLNKSVFIKNIRISSKINPQIDLLNVVDYIKNEFSKCKHENENEFWNKIKKDKLLVQNNIHLLNFEKKLINEFTNLDNKKDYYLLQSFHQYLIQNNVNNNKILFSDYGCFLIKLDSKKYENEINLIFQNLIDLNLLDISENFLLAFSKLSIDNCRKVLSLQTIPTKKFLYIFLYILLEFNLIDELIIIIQKHVNSINDSFFKYLLDCCLENKINEIEFRRIINELNIKNVNLIDHFDYMFEQLDKVFLHFGYTRNNTRITQYDLKCTLCKQEVATVNNEEILKLLKHLNNTMLKQSSEVEMNLKKLKSFLKNKNFDLIIDGLNFLFLSNKIYYYVSNNQGIVRKVKSDLSLSYEAEKLYFKLIKPLNFKKILVLTRNHTLNLNVIKKMSKDGCSIFLLPNYIDDDYFILYSALSSKNSFIFSRDQYRKYFINCKDETIENYYNKWYQSRLIKLEDNSKCYIDRSCLQINLSKNFIHLPVKKINSFFINIQWYCYSRK